MTRACSMHRWIGPGAAMAAAAALAGCAAIAPVTRPIADQLQSSAHDFIEATRMSPPGVNPASPIAADAAKAEHVAGPVPSFASVPPKPGDIPPPSAYKAQVVDLVADRRGLNRWSAANPPAVEDAKVSEAYAAAQRRRVGDEAAVSPEKQGETEAFAKKGRQAVEQPEAIPPKSPN